MTKHGTSSLFCITPECLICFRSSREPPAPQHLSSRALKTHWMIAIERVSWKRARVRRRSLVGRGTHRPSGCISGAARPGIYCMVDAIIRQVALPSCCRGTGKPSASQLRPDIHTCQRSVRLRCRSDEYRSSVQQDHSSGERETLLARVKPHSVLPLTLIGWLKRRPRLPAS